MKSTTAGRRGKIDRIMAAQRELAHAFASVRSGPLLAANLTMSQLKVLLVLARHDGASGHELTSVLGVGLATMTGIVDRLVAHDLVVRQEDPLDRRVRRVLLTTTGRELVDGIMLAGMQHQRRLLDRLDSDQLAIVEQALGYLVEAAEAERLAGSAATGAEEALSAAAAERAATAERRTGQPAAGAGRGSAPPPSERSAARP